jgi:D-alanine-D-alanine ligase-like ATP-grasp enzyme
MGELENTQYIQVKAHYAFATKILIDLFNKGELPLIRAISIEPEYGYVGRLVYQDHSIRMFRGSDVGINSASAMQMATDKGYAKYFLDLLGYQTPKGKVVLLPQYVQVLEKALAKYSFQDYARVDQVDHYITATIGYPCFLKPNEGAQGKGVTKCTNKDDVEHTIAQYQQDHIKTLLVEEAIVWPDYRVVIFQDKVIACYRRTPLAVIGDGKSTINELLHQKYEQLNKSSRSALIDFDDARIARQLLRRDYTLETVLPKLVECPIHDISNLSAGGEVEDFTDRICAHWSNLCIKVTAEMGLNLCGVDLACSDIENADAEYSIIEINASPGLANYVAIGQEQFERVRVLYRQIFEHNHFLPPSA